MDPTPVPDSARHRGREAFFAGLAREACPFPRGSGEWRHWTGAWEEAREGRERLDEQLRREA